MRNDQTPSTNMFEELNAETFVKLWLFELDAPDGTVYFAQNTENVNYGGQLYMAWPIEHQGINENARGQVDNMTIRVGNLTEDISALLELYDGLRGCRIRILQVINVDDPQAYIEDIYHIDSTRVGNQSAEFTLTSKYQIMEAQIAPRMYSRVFCRWGYKERGCWAGDGYGYTFNQPADFVSGDPDTCNKTPEDCKRHKNFMRFGAQPSIPKTKVIRV